MQLPANSPDLICPAYLEKKSVENSGGELDRVLVGGVEGVDDAGAAVGLPAVLVDGPAELLAVVVQDKLLQPKRKEDV